MLVITLMAVAVIGYAVAAFTDEEVVADSEFEAGTIELDVQGNSEELQTYEFKNIKPGDIGGWSGLHGSSQWHEGRPIYTVTNTGSLPAVLTVSIDNIRDYDAGGNEISSSDGSLSWAMRIQHRVDGTYRAEGHLSRNDWETEVDLGPGESATFDYMWQLNAEPNGGWNVLQGHSTKFDVHFDLVQQSGVTVDTNY